MHEAALGKAQHLRRARPSLSRFMANNATALKSHTSRFQCANRPGDRVGVSAEGLVSLAQWSFEPGDCHSANTSALCEHAARPAKQTARSA
jgi:hypothetical protein